MGSLFYFYVFTLLWLGLIGLGAYWFDQWRALSMKQALIFRLVGWLTLFLGFVRRLGWSDSSYRTLGGNSSIEAMDLWMFALVVSVGLFCLFVAWIKQYEWVGLMRSRKAQLPDDEILD